MSMDQILPNFIFSFQISIFLSTCSEYFLNIQERKFKLYFLNVDLPVAVLEHFNVYNFSMRTPMCTIAGRLEIQSSFLKG